MAEDKEVKLTLHASTILLHDLLYPKALNFNRFARMLDKVVGVIAHDRMDVEYKILETEFECPSNYLRNFLVDRLAHLSLVLPLGMCRNIISQFLDRSNQEALLQLCKTRNVEFSSVELQIPPPFYHVQWHQQPCPAFLQSDQSLGLLDKVNHVKV
jgi:hypothetical protein